MSTSEGAGRVLREILDIDYDAAAEQISSFIGEAVASSGRAGIVVGLSGGLDSAVTALLCSRAATTHALILPDARVTPRADTADAEALAARLGCERRTADIAPMVDAIAAGAGGGERALGNLRARVRMCAIYHHANSRDLLVAGTSNRSELLVGYFTKHGDGAADILPLASLYKVQVRELARRIGVPEQISSKQPAPHLWAGHYAEDELGAAYGEIDAALECIVRRGMADGEAAAASGVRREIISRVRGLYEASAHKRAPARRPGDDLT